MRKLGLASLTLVLLVGVAPAAPPKIAEQTWDVVYLDGAKAGFLHTKIAPDAAKKDLLHAFSDLQLKLKRFHDTAELRMIQGDDENAQGEVTGVFMRQYLGKQEQLQIRGTVDGAAVELTVLDGQGRVRQKKKNPWNKSVVGLYAQQHLYRDRKVKPGDVFSYQSFEPSLTAVFNTQVDVKDYENVRFLSTGKSRKLLRIEAVADKIAGFRPPPLTIWVDDKGDAVRTQFHMDGLGLLTLERTSKAFATAGSSTTARLSPDIGFRQLIPLNRRLPRGLATRSAVYHITIEGEKDVADAFAHDNRQDIKNAHGNAFDLYVHPPRDTKPARTEKPGKEYLAASYFINNDDARVRQLARRAVGSETDPWTRARRISQWVFQHVHDTYEVGFDTADQVARHLQGDCTEHAVLAAAMCKAEGIPARTAIGLVYTVNRDRPPVGPVLAFHMWTEVWIDGQWRGIDPTMGGHVGAGHLKITAHSWYDTASLKPLLPLQRVLGKTRIKLVRVDGDAN